MSVVTAVTALCTSVSILGVLYRCAIFSFTQHLALMLLMSAVALCPKQIA